MPADDRIERLSREIAERLRPTCAHLADADFAALVDDVARASLRFAEIDANPRLWHTVEQWELPLAPLATTTGVAGDKPVGGATGPSA